MPIPISRPEPLIPWTQLARQARFREQALARQFGRSPMQLRRYFAEELGIPLGQWLYHRRWTYALRLLLAKVPLKAISDEIGLSHKAAVSRGLKVCYGTGVMKLRKNPEEFVIAMLVPQSSNVNKLASLSSQKCASIGRLAEKK